MKKYYCIMVGVFLFQLANTVMACLYLSQWSQNLSFLGLGFVTAFGIAMLINSREQNRTEKIIQEIEDIYKEAQDILEQVKKDCLKMREDCHQEIVNKLEEMRSRHGVSN